MVNIANLYAKLSRNESLRQADGMAVLEELERMGSLAAYLASCHAASLESLPKSASKRERQRLIAICETAAKGLTGDMSGLVSRPSVVDAARRCSRAVSEQTFEERRGA